MTLPRTQTNILMDGDTALVSTRARGVVEGVAIKLGEMMDEPRHVRAGRRLPLRSRYSP